MPENPNPAEPWNPKKRRSRAIEDMLMDSLHAMAFIERAEHSQTPLLSTPPGQTGVGIGDGDDDSSSSIFNRVSELTGQVLRFAQRSTDTSLKLGRTLINAQDQLKLMLAAGESLKDIREVAGLTLSEMSEALNLKDKSILEAIENGTSTVSFELILRLAALVARNDPLPFIMRATRNYNPEVWQVLNDWGIGKLPLQFERERQFINIFRGHDEARKLSDEGFAQVLKFTRQSFEMSLHFVAEQEKALDNARMKMQTEMSFGKSPGPEPSGK